LHICGAKLQGLPHLATKKNDEKPWIQLKQAKDVGVIYNGKK
jgi:hypothetical protein